MSLYDVLSDAARGRPPEADGTVEVLPQQGLAAAVVAFSAHFVVCADVEPDWVTGVLPPGDYTAPHGARFLVALADRIGSDIGALDVVLAQPPDPTAADGLGLEEIEARDHPRVVRALRYRGDVRVWRTPGDAGHVLIGRGLAGRWEMAFEVQPSARGPAWADGSPERARRWRRRTSWSGPRSPRAPGVAARGARRRLPPGLRRGPAPAAPVTG